MAQITARELKTKTGKTIVIRTCFPSDAYLLNPLLQRLANESQFINQYVGQPTKTVTEVQTRWQKALESKVEIYIGAFDGEKLVGQLGVHVDRPEHPWLGKIAHFGMGVLKDYWGNGVGQALVRAMDEHARKAELIRIEGTVRAKNERGLTFYKKLDFRFEGTRAACALIDGELQDEQYIARLYVEKKPSWLPPTLETDRFILRALKIEDAASIFEYAQKETVARYVGYSRHTSIEDAKHFICDYAFNKYENDRVPEPLGIAFKDNPNKIIGTVGCFWRAKNFRQLEMGYALDDIHWGKGIMVEAGRAVLKYVFENFEISRVQAHCRYENKQSSRVMEKLGMKFEGIQKQSVFVKGMYWDTAHYAILKSEFN